MNRQLITLFAASGLTLTVLSFAGLRPIQDKKPQAISDDDAMFFESRIRPLFIDKCQSCHGDAKQLGGLRLDTFVAFNAGGKGGAIYVASKPSESKICKAVSYTGELKMPPGGKLPQSQIDDLNDWIKRGAPWPQTKAPATGGAMVFTPAQKGFWSFQPVKNQFAPTVKFPKMVNNPVDAYVESELERKGLMLSPNADKRTLIRRATFDLTGLPPTPEEISAFVADNSTNAYEKVVDRLLASPRYGERWGRHWLDLVRYCDSLDVRSLGAEGDIGLAWKYRDWVVNSFNNDFPYDKFVQYQIGGDLLPPSDAPVKSRFNKNGTSATGVLAIGNWGNGDADKEKIYTDIVDDQVDVVSRTFLGLTVGCARCHNHKFDPISTKDYYGLAGFFFSTHILDKFTPKGAGENIQRVALVSPEEEAYRKQYAAKLADLTDKIRVERDNARQEFARRQLSKTAEYVAASSVLRSANSQEIETYSKSHGLYGFAIKQWRDALGFGAFHRMSTAITSVLNNAGVNGFKGPNDTPSIVVNSTPEAKAILTFTLPPRSVNVHPGPQSGVLVAWNSPISGTVSIGGKVTDADPAGGDGIAWLLVHRNKAGASEIASGAFDNGGAQPFAIGKGADNLKLIQVAKGDRIELQVLPKMSHTCDTTTVDWTINSADKTWDISRDLVENIHAGNPHPDSFGNPDIWSFEDMDASGELLKLDGSSKAALAQWKVEQAASGAESAGSKVLAEKFAKEFNLVDARSPFWISNPADEAALPEGYRPRVAQLNQQMAELQKTAPGPVEFANAVRDGGIPETIYAGFHDVNVHIRGSYARLGDLVPRTFPAILNNSRKTPELHGSGRAELAQWVGSSQNPLTARVWVNRIWQKHFGDGIVRTTSNFGFLGERPTNQPLLDYLASSLINGVNGGKPWSTKAIHKLIMLSHTYQQTSKVTPLARKIDADNRLLGHQNRQRLESEAIRDSLLNASGQLDLTAGGPPVREFATPRRSLYIITIRSDRTGFGPLFDVADSTAHVDHRINSTVAPQALYMMNSEFVRNQADKLAVRLKGMSGINDGGRIHTAYQLLYGRDPGTSEVKIGVDYLQRSGGKWDSYCKLLLSANEFVYVD